MGVATYSDREDHTAYHTRPRASPTAKLFRRLCEVVLFFMCLAVIGGIVMGVVAIHNAAASNGPEDEGAHARKLFARSYYDNVIISGTSNPTGTAPVPMDNATIVMNTASGVVSSGPSVSVTVTVDGVGGVGAPEASTEAGMSATGVTVTVTSTSTTVTNTRTVTAAQVLSLASVASSIEESTPGVFVSEPACDCVPATVTLTVTETASPAPAAQMDPTSKPRAPFTTLIIPDLYSKWAKPTQSVFSVHALSVTEETTTVTEEVIETVTETASDANIADKQIPVTTAKSGNELTPAGGSDRTVTVTVFEQPTVIITSTMIADNEMPSSRATPKNSADVPTQPCASENVTAPANPRATVTLSKIVTETYTTTVDGSASLMIGVKTVFTTEVVGVEETVFATGTVGAFSNTVASLMTITVQPAPEVTQPAPEATQAAPTNAASPVTILEGSFSTQGKRADAIITGCVVVFVTTVLCML